MSDNSAPAGAPFDKPDADVIYAPSAHGEVAAEKRGIPVVDITEDRVAVDILLRFCYPGEVPELLTFDGVKKGLEMVRKYQVEGAMPFIRRSLVSPELLEENRLRVYAIACLYELHQEAIVSARACLRLQQTELWDSDDIPEFSSVPVEAFIRLGQYHRKCGDAAAMVVESWSSGWLEHARIHSFCFFRCQSCNGTSSCYSLAGYVRASKSRWWDSFMQDVKKAIKQQPLAPLTMDILPWEYLMTPAQCATCRATVGQDICQFLDLFSRSLTEAIEKVQLVCLSDIGAGRSLRPEAWKRWLSIG
ncbi:hypothetical protein OE88DRAFT_1737817 [Heliocybe sulcata]|uniref:BTB domain-containing protein n=1 Tax=Heliocybe sulcata TaxID=5364 RepID=A0A5C3MXV0_9AGAM|nr:hypothetical protein OE88DRAFT_1737817 [Heliocybe sulcata]